MRFGTFLEFPCPPGADTAQAYAHAFEHVDQAEAAGLDIVDVAEFHFTPNRVVSSPITLAAAIAGRTKRIKVGTSVLVLPLGNPIRMAEETATLDHVSQGRFELGVGRSGFQVSYDGYGIAYEESRDRFQEALDVIVGAWTNERFSYSGKYYSYNDVCLVPKPFQHPHPPIRIAATSNETFPMIGRMSYSLLVGLRQVSLSRLAEQVASYREAWNDSGHVGVPDISLRVPVYVAPTHQDAINEAEESFMRQFRRVGSQMQSQIGTPGVSGARAQIGAELAAITWDEVVRERVIVGSPEDCVAQLRRFEQALGLTEVVAEFNAGELISPERIARSLDLFSEQVIPQFGKS